MSFSVVFIAIGFALTYYLWAYVEERELQKTQNQIESLSKQNAHLIEKQLDTYINSIYALRAFFIASSYVDHNEFNSFVSSLNLNESHPGIKALGFVELVNAKNKDDFTSRLGQEGIHHYNINPAGLREAYAPITYIYPLNTTNLQVLGYDVLTEPTRRSAILQSTTYNKAFITSPLELLQDKFSSLNNALVKAESYVIFLPIRQSRSHNMNKPVRFADTDGWVYIAFNMKELVSAALNQNINNLNLAIFDGDTAKQDNLIYSNAANTRTLNTFTSIKPVKIDVNNKSWMFYSTPKTKIEQPAYSYKPIYILEIGLVLSLLFGFSIWLLIERSYTLKEVDLFHQKLTEKERIWKLALEGAGDGVWDYEVNQNRNRISKKWAELLGYSENELSDDISEWRERIHPDDYPTVMQTLEDYLAGKSKLYSIEHRLRCKDNSWKWILARGMIVERDRLFRPTRMVGTITDISKMKASEALILEQANFDALTGLANRRAFFARLNHEIKIYDRYQYGFALLFIDLDEFKEVNDQYGHHTGDEVLKDISKRILETIRSTDLVARLGGDEFIVLLSNLDAPKHAESLAQKLLESITHPINVDGDSVTVSASLGIAHCPLNGTVADTLINKADKAMYAAKNKGKNCWASFPETTEPTDEETKLT